MAKFCNNCEKSVETKTDRESGHLLCAECGNILGYAAAALPRGTIIAGYRIEDSIGHGGMGVVYRAIQENLQRPAALKILSDELSDEPGFVESFFHEARVAANLTHPNIVQAYAAGTTKDGINYFAMELIEGESLEVKLKRSGPLPPVPAMDTAIQLAKALEYAWNTKKMCHGDIKPDNLLITKNNILKLADLGLARSVYEENAKRDVMVTPLYAAPELISGKQISPSLHSDMYSYGATLYHIVVGHPPFESGKIEEIYQRHLTENPVPPIEINQEIPEKLSRLIIRLIAKTPEERPKDWTEIISELAHITEDVSTYKKQIPENRKIEIIAENKVPEKHSSSMPKKILFASAAVILILAAMFILRSSQTSEDVLPEKKQTDKPLPISSEAKTVIQKPNVQMEQLREKWLIEKEKMRTDTPQNKIDAYSNFLRSNMITEQLEKEINEELESLKLEIKQEQLKQQKQQAAEYRKNIDAFLNSPLLIWEGAKEINARMQIYYMLINQGRLPHLSEEYQNKQYDLIIVHKILELRLQKLNKLGLLPYEISQKNNQKASDSKKDYLKTLDIEYDRLLKPHIRHFSSKELKHGMTLFAKRHKNIDNLTIRKARAIGDNLGDKVFLSHLYKSSKELNNAPLSRFGKNVFLINATPSSVRVSIQDGRFVVRKWIPLNQSNIARLRLSVYDLYRNPVWRERFSPDFLYFICFTSIFYDSRHAIENVKNYNAAKKQKELMEDILRDISELSARH